MYKIVIEPLSPIDWDHHEARRIRVALRRWEGEESFPLIMVGSGLASWATYALREAVRRAIRDAQREHFHSEESEEAVLAAEEGSGRILIQRPPLYLLDEPERNLIRWLKKKQPDGSLLVPKREPT